MSRFFLTETDRVENQSITLYGENYHHLAHVLRARTGEHITVCDGRGTDYECVLRKIDRQSAEFSVERVLPSQGESGLHITLFQCLAKGEKMEQIISRSVEMGVDKIVPVLSRFCIAKIQPGDSGKLERYQKIALSAAKQCGRGKIPQICAPVDIREAITMLSSLQNSFVCYENEKEETLLDFSFTGSEIGFLIGPEGGLAGEEEQMWRAAHIPSLSLGRRILRTENAAAFVLPILYCKYGEL